MANRYANLIGSNKIKDEYTKINAGFDVVQAEMDAVNAELDQKAERAFAQVNDLIADTKADTLTIEGGTGIIVTTNPNTKTVNITATGEATPGPHGSEHLEFGSDPIPFATPTEGGLMSAADKAKLDSFCVSVKEFGAVGDGVADDTTAFQSAFDAIRDAGGGTVFVPKGTYCLFSRLRIYANTTLWLDDHAVIKRCFSGNLIINGEYGNANYASGYDGDGNIFVYGGTFDLNGAEFPPNPTTGHGGVAFAFAHARNIRFENVRFKNVWNDHYIEINSSKNVKIINCTFENGTSTGSSLYEAVQIDLASQTPFPHFGAYDLTPCEDVLVTGCTFENVHSGVGSHSSALNDGVQVTHKNIRVIGNYFKDTKLAAIRTESWEKSIIAHNQIINTGDNGIHIWASHEIVVVGNTVDTAVEHGISLIRLTVDTTTIVPSRIMVSGNIIKNARAGIRALQATSSTFANNRIYGTREHGIYFSQFISDLLIEGNYIEGPSQSGSFAGIEIRDSVRVRVVGNIVRKGGYTNNYTYALSIPSGNTGVIEYDNQFEPGANGRVSDSGVLSAVNREVMLTNQINVSSGSVTLLDDITKYRYIIVATGTVSGGGLRHAIARGWHINGFRPGTDFISVPTNNGKFVASVDTPTQITITTANDPLRYIIGVL